MVAVVAVVVDFGVLFVVHLVHLGRRGRRGRRLQRDGGKFGLCIGRLKSNRFPLSPPSMPMPSFHGFVPQRTSDFSFHIHLAIVVFLHHHRRFPFLPSILVAAASAAASAAVAVVVVVACTRSFLLLLLLLLRAPRFPLLQTPKNFCKQNGITGNAGGDLRNLCKNKYQVKQFN